MSGPAVGGNAPNVAFFSVADIKDPRDPQGRSYRQVNAAKTHSIPVGSLVETESGTRLWVAFQGRDCDMTSLYGTSLYGTSLYWLSPLKDDTERESQTFANSKWVGGFLECSVRKIASPKTIKDPIVVSLGDLFADSCSICGNRAEWGVASQGGPDGCREAVMSGRTFCEKHLPGGLRTSMTMSGMTLMARKKGRTNG